MNDPSWRRKMQVSVHALCLITGPVPATHTYMLLAVFDESLRLQKWTHKSNMALVVPQTLYAETAPHLCDTLDYQTSHPYM